MDDRLRIDVVGIEWVVTYGQHPLRQVLHPQSTEPLPQYLNKFVDLRKVASSRFSDSSSSDSSDVSEGKFYFIKKLRVSGFVMVVVVVVGEYC
jgi:hypothetical protein